MDSMEIPEKLYFKIGEVAELVGVPPYVLRYWETEFPEIAPVKSRTQHRLYKRKNVEFLLKVKELLYQQKFTIEGARRKLKNLIKEEKGGEDSGQAVLFQTDSPSSEKEFAFLMHKKKELEELLIALKDLKGIL